jgi:hypothetical protein
MHAMRHLRPIAMLCLAFALPGCQTDTSTTASGSPEIIVNGARPESVKPKIINAVLDLGMTLKNDTPIEVTVERPWKVTPEPGVITSFAELDGPAIVERLTFSLTDSSGGTRVTLDRYIVRTSRLGKEYVKPANNAPGVEKLQAILDAVAPSLGTTTTIDLPIAHSQNPPPRISAPLTKLVTENLQRR